MMVMMQEPQGSVALLEGGPEGSDGLKTITAANPDELREMDPEVDLSLSRTRTLSLSFSNTHTHSLSLSLSL